MLESLISETKEILAYTEKATGYSIKPIPVERAYLSRTMLSQLSSNQERPEIVITYNPESKSIDYAIAHEAVRFLRFMRAPPEKRYVLYSTKENRFKAYQQMEKDIEGKAESQKEFIRQGFQHFYDGLMTQLVSTPSDFWINNWLYHEFPSFKDEIERSVKEIFDKAHQSLNFRIEQLTPRTVYKASNAMNAAFSLFMDKLLDREEFSEPYEATDFWKIGKRLKQLNSTDAGHQGDRETADRWAGLLSIGDWYS